VRGWTASDVSSFSGLLHAKPRTVRMKIFFDTHFFLSLNTEFAGSFHVVCEIDNPFKSYVAGNNKIEMCPALLIMCRFLFNPSLMPTRESPSFWRLVYAKPQIVRMSKFFDIHFLLFLNTENAGSFHVLDNRNCLNFGLCFDFVTVLL